MTMDNAFFRPKPHSHPEKVYNEVQLKAYRPYKNSFILSCLAYNQGVFYDHKVISKAKPNINMASSVRFQPDMLESYHNFATEEELYDFVFYLTKDNIDTNIKILSNKAKDGNFNDFFGVKFTQENLSKVNGFMKSIGYKEIKQYIQKNLFDDLKEASFIDSFAVDDANIPEMELDLLRY